MRVIGTAGHVDHGKSTLVRYLTGIDPDRWQEEKARGLTIDLGFAWFDLAGGERVGIVDVPGHRDFIENMLAGVGGIDAALLVIAADEGVMPQTREHLAILDLLGVSNGLIVLSKVDIVDDDDWLDLVELDIEEVIEGNALQDAEIVRVSAKTGTGIDTLVDRLTTLLETIPERVNYNQPRLPIDRVFSVEGFGTVVTGTLSGGTLSIGDTVEIQPSGLSGRIRGLQSYQQEIETALPGSRVAVNISGIHKNEISRGDVLAYAGQLHATQLVDVRLQYLEGLDKPLRHNAEVKFFSGASETVARVRLLGDEVLQPASVGWVQLRLRDAIPLTQRDRFILRYPSPAETIGGGVIVDPMPEKRWRRFQDNVIASLQTRFDGSPEERVVQAADRDSPQKYVHLQKTTGFNDSDLDTAIEAALANGQLMALADDTFWSTARVHLLLARIDDIVGAYHDTYPLRLGIAREELRRQLEVKNNLLAILLDLSDDVVAQNDLVRMAGFQIVFSDSQRVAIDDLLREMSASATTPPSYNEAVEVAGQDVLHALIDLGEIVQVSDNVIFTQDVYHEMVQRVIELFDAHDHIDAKLVRDTLDTSRKYAIALLEYLDDAGITKRVGDVRVRGRVDV